MSKRTSRTIYLMVSIFILTILPADSRAKVVYVDDDAVGANDGSSWQNAYTFLQDALSEATHFADKEKTVEIRVAQGIYTPDTNSVTPDGTGNEEATFQLIT